MKRTLALLLLLSTGCTNGPQVVQAFCEVEFAKRTEGPPGFFTYLCAEGWTVFGVVKDGKQYTMCSACDPIESAKGAVGEFGVCLR